MALEKVIDTVISKPGIKFNTAFSRSPVSFSEPGDDEKIIYSSRFASDGSIEVFESGKASMKEYINSFADSCNIHNILARYENGEVDVLSRSQGVYVDAVNMPHSYSELLNTVIQGEQTFNSLPKEIKERFNNNFAEYISAMDNPDKFTELMNMSDKSDSNKSSESEVSE